MQANSPCSSTPPTLKERLLRYWANPHYTVGLLVFSAVALWLAYLFIFTTWETGWLDKERLGDLILISEVALACKKAIEEEGHFPVRYIMLFVLTALGFSLAINKTDLGVVVFAMEGIFFVMFGFVYIHFNKVHRDAMHAKAETRKARI
jgi:hypothetical protein